jgi:hypothetical protein
MGNTPVPKRIFRLSRFPVYRGSGLDRFYCSRSYDLSGAIFGVTVNFISNVSYVALCLNYYNDSEGFKDEYIRSCWQKNKYNLNNSIET